MSSQDQLEVSYETSSLLGDSGRPTDRADHNGLRLDLRWPPEILLIPVALATSLASTIQVTTFIELVRWRICSIWDMSHSGGPGMLLPVAGRSVLPNTCDTPEIARYFSTVVAIIGAIGGVLAIIGCTFLSAISSRYGRKPAFLLLLIAGVIGSCLIPGSQYLPDSLVNWVFLAGTLFQLLSNASLFAYLVNVYIVDICLPKDRTAALSRTAGWITLGGCISFALGGLVTTKTKNPLVVFYASTAMYVSMLIYVISVLPESFPEDKRNALFLTRQESSLDEPLDAVRPKSLFIFQPLKMLVPIPKPDGTRNWRLVWCAAHTFMITAVNSYSLTAWVVFATSKYHLSPMDTGLFLSVSTVSGTIFLTVIVPPLLRSMRPYYIRKITRSSRVEDVDSATNSEEQQLKPSDQLDVHLAFVSCVILAIFILAAAASPTNVALIFSAIFIGFACVHGPTMRGLVASSVDPLRQGEALAAIEIVSNAGACLSPIIMGGLLAATIGTTPLLAFYVHLVVVLMGGALLFLIRDVDGYNEPQLR